MSTARIPRLSVRRLLATVLPPAILLPVLWGPARAYELRFNCGGANYTAVDGTFFAADRLYTPGNAGYIDGYDFYNWHVVGGTPDQNLYAYFRFSLTEYRFDLPNGPYLVTLHFVEHFKHSTGETQFDVKIEGQEVISNLDLYALVQRTYAIDLPVAATVADGQLNVTFVRDFGVVSIAAISVVSRAADVVPPLPPAGLAAADNYLAVGLDWDDSPEDDIAGYTVERSASPGGPFTPVSGALERVSRRLDPRAPSGPWYYQVRAVDVFGNSSIPSPLVSATALPHSATTLPIVEVLIHPDSLEILNDTPTTNDYVECDVAFDGAVFPNAIARYRGNVSRSLLKKSWKLKLESGLYAGRDNFNVNAEYIDKSLMRERLAYELIGRNNCPAPRARHVHTVVNGQWMGVNTDVENVDVEFLERVGLEPDNANLYKVRESSGNLSMLPNTQQYMTVYEKEMGDPADYSDLIALIEALNLTAPDSMFHYLAGHVDLNRFVDFYATESVLSNPDINFKNWFLHHDLGADRWTVIPFDRDLTFGQISPFGEGITTNYTMYVGTANYLFRQVQNVPVLKQLFFDRVRQIFATTFVPAAMDGLIDSAYAPIVADGERDWWKWGWERNEWFHAAPDQIRSYVTGRTAYLNGQITAQENPPALVINEIQASNATTVTDEWGDFADWIEIMNRGSAPAPLLGVYLTDDLTIPEKFAFMDTVLAPGERLIVWADSEPLEGPLHAPFEIDADGEEVGLFYGPPAARAPIDVRIFDPQLTDASLGRLPDGSPYWQVLATPTPGAANVGGGNIRPQVNGVAHFPPAPPADSPVHITALIADDGTLTSTQVYYDAGAGFIAETLRDDGQSGDGDAGDGRFGTFLPGQPALTTVLYYVRAEDNLGAVTTDPRGAPTTTYAFTAGYVAPPLKLNEFMAANAATVADEQGDYDDWVELWNAGSDTLALDGMHLTDDLPNATKWIFPAVSLAPGAFLIVWCDAEPAEGPLHTTFKLSAGGEEIGLFDTAGTGVGLIDSVAFTSQANDVSLGRVPDGGAWILLTNPTPGATNGTGTGIGGEGEGAPPRVLALRGPYPNPFGRSAALEVMLPAPGVARLVVHDVAGRRVRGLIDRPLLAGRHRAVWDGRDDRGRPVASGVYWLQLEVGGERRLARAVRVR